MKDALTLSEIADALGTLADVMVSDRTDELAGYAGGYRAANCLACSALGSAGVMKEEDSK